MDQQEPAIQKKWAMRPLNKLDMIMLAILCIITMGIASYDFYNQKEIEQRCLTDCNNHWVNEFKTKCPGPWGEEKSFTESLIYNYTPPEEKT